MFIGAHISREKTILETINKIIENDGNALQIFISNPRSNKITNINEKYFINLEKINEYINKINFKIVIHNPYTINLASSFMNGKKIIDINDCYWIQLILNELKISELLGSYGCVVHCGKYTKNTKEEGLNNMKLALKYIITQMIKFKLKTKLILETSAGQGTELLSNYEDFLEFYNSFDDIEKEYLKICIDTCHVWASGYELMEIYNITKKNNNFKDIGVIHINKSKNPKNSKLDRHDTIIEEKAYIDINDIIKFVNKMKKINNEIIFILETPSNKLDYEIKLLK